MTSVSRVDIRPWNLPMRAPYRSAQRITTVARNVLATVFLSDGSVGYGESAPATYVTGETQESVVETASALARTLIGQPIRDALAAIECAETMPGVRLALSMALLDALAKERRLPLCHLLADFLSLPRPTEFSRVTDLSLPILEPGDAAGRAANAASRGFSCFKVKVGSGNFDEDLARVLAVADAAPDATIRLDGNQGFSARDAISFFNALEPIHPRLELFEQPTPADDDDAMREVARAISIPVFADESCHDEHDARRLIESGACSGVVVKLAKSGFYGAFRIAHATWKSGGRTLLGCMQESRLAIGATLHLALVLGEDLAPLLDLDTHLYVNDDQELVGGIDHDHPEIAVDPAEFGIGVRRFATG